MPACCGSSGLERLRWMLFCGRRVVCVVASGVEAAAVAGVDLAITRPVHRQARAIAVSAAHERAWWAAAVPAWEGAGLQRALHGELGTGATGNNVWP